MVALINQLLTYIQTVTHPSTNRTQCRLTTLIKANVRANHYNTAPVVVYCHLVLVLFVSQLPKYGIPYEYLLTFSSLKHSLHLDVI